jgi:glycosyltransferase involved in cell wall biosynthesis
VISIIVALKNEAQNVLPLFQSLVEFATNEEIIVWDGLSSDDTKEQVKRFERNLGNMKVLSGKDSGIYDAWNKALNHSTGNFLLFLGAGDRLLRPLPDMRKLTRNELYSLGVCTDHSSENLSIPRIRNCYRSPRHGIPCPNPGTLYPTTGIKHLGPFNASFAVAGDYEMQIRLIRAGINVNRCYATDLYVEHDLSGVSARKSIRASILKEMSKAAAQERLIFTAVYHYFRAVLAYYRNMVL